MEAQQQPMAPLTKKHLTVKNLQRFYAKLNNAMDYLEEIDRNVERTGLSRRRVAAELAQYDQLLYEKKRDACQATLNSFLSKASCPEAPASDKPHPSTSTGGFTCITPSSLASNVDDPDVV